MENSKEELFGGNFSTGIEKFRFNEAGVLTPERPSAFLVWAFGLSFVTVIGLCAVTGIVFMRCLKKEAYSRFITFFVSLGVGSLSGSAVFHLIPQAFGLADEFNPNANHDYLMKSFSTIVGVYLFFFSDKAIKLCLEERKRSRRQKFLPLQREDKKENTLSESAAAEQARQNQSKVGSIFEEQHTLAELNFVAQENNTEQFMNRQAHSLCVHDHDLNYKQGDSAIAMVAWMIIFGDGLHNFIDGISIGTSFSESILGGISVSVAVLCEEFPHELGDVAILINAGMSVKQALLYNLLSALSCYIGFVIGVVVGNISDDFASYTFGFAGGMFLYISMACMMPEMKNAMEKALESSLKKALEVLTLQAAGVLVGVSIMWTMSRYGGSIRF